MELKAHSTQQRAGAVSLFLLFLFVMLGKYNLYVGFAIKPHMIFLALFFLIHLASFYFHRLQLFECAMLLFYGVYSFTGAFALYPMSSIRIIIGIVIYVGCYFFMKALIGNAGPNAIEKSLSTVGLIFNGASLVLYFIGLKSLGFVFQGDMITSFGVLIDRDYPRLIGLLQDPNYYVFYNTIFFAFYLCSSGSWKNRFGLMLCLVTNILTFSRGGIAVMLLIFLLYIIILPSPRKKLKLAGGAILSLVVGVYGAVSFLKFDIYGVLKSRISDFSNDGGSGRFELWGRAWDYFNENIWTGVGAYNFPDYNTYEYGDALRVHNTFLDILSESGILGFSAFLLFLLFVMVQLLQNRVHREKPYLFLTFIGFMLQMASLSIIINDLFFLYLAILAVYLSGVPKKNKGVRYDERPAFNR
ncbi:O-antigen ligase family protein [Fictibacillus aquaticus]|uniref:Polysaccharide polymerase n=1 Tax=Fictibacillus aquaticus TaxID=2021314 RepID=A0A235F8T0_9BACL|nr:O-antigen ligase family protein [Fictibacillus aquaticus]OYD57720.1 polysaccharide polymerase [Fictibacillus aquaticus]